VILRISILAEQCLRG